MTTHPTAAPRLSGRKDRLHRPPAEFVPQALIERLHRSGRDEAEQWARRARAVVIKVHEMLEAAHYDVATLAGMDQSLGRLMTSGDARPQDVQRLGRHLGRWARARASLWDAVEHTMGLLLEQVFRAPERQAAVFLAAHGDRLVDRLRDVVVGTTTHETRTVVISAEEAGRRVNALLMGATDRGRSMPAGMLLPRDAVSSETHWVTQMVAAAVWANAHGTPFLDPTMTGALRAWMSTPCAEAAFEPYVAPVRAHALALLDQRTLTAAAGRSDTAAPVETAPCRAGRRM